MHPAGPPVFRASRRLALMWSVLISLRMSARANVLATLPAPITAIAELAVVPVFCQLTNALAQLRRCPIGHILGLLRNPPSTLLRPPRCGIWCWVQIHPDNL